MIVYQIITILFVYAKAFIISMNENENNCEEKTLFEKRGLTMFSSIMTSELQNEMNQLLTEQKNYQLEISQLKKERNFLFKLLKKQKKNQKEKLKSTKENSTKFSFYHQEQISIPPTKDFKINNSDQFNSEDKPDDTSSLSNFSNDKKYFFTKSILLDEIKKYSKNSVFERLSEITDLSNNGDSMISYFVNTVGDAFIAYELQNKKLREDLYRIKNKQRKAFINSVESLTESKKPDVEILSNIIESYDFDDDDDSIFSDISQNADFIGNSEEFNDFDCIDLNISKQETLETDGNDIDHIQCFDNLTDFTSNIYF